MKNEKLDMLKSNIEFYPLEPELIEDLDTLLKHIQTKEMFIISHKNNMYHKTSKTDNTKTVTEEQPTGHSPLCILIEADEEPIIKFHKQLLNTTANFHKNMRGPGSIGVCFDTNAIDHLIKIISSNPPLINKLYINTPVLNKLHSRYTTE